jgi:hypothetical protein
MSSRERREKVGKGNKERTKEKQKEATNNAKATKGNRETIAAGKWVRE